MRASDATVGRRLTLAPRVREPKGGRRLSEIGEAWLDAHRGDFADAKRTQRVPLERAAPDGIAAGQDFDRDGTVCGNRKRRAPWRSCNAMSR
jgi:hypothetical protein